jgi:hypothetical protein
MEGTLVPMSKTNPSLDVLRHRLSKAESGNLGNLMIAFSELVSHPDAEWRDIYEGFKYRSLADDAALRLHDLLKIPRKPLEANRDPLFWDDVLKKAGMDRSDKVGSWKTFRWRFQGE